MATETTRVWDNGVVVESFETQIPDEIVNQRAILGQAVTALTNNTAYLAVNNPNSAQVVAQVEALTRQNNKIIRLILQRFDATD